MLNGFCFIFWWKGTKSLIDFLELHIYFETINLNRCFKDTASSTKCHSCSVVINSCQHFVVPTISLSTNKPTFNVPLQGSSYINIYKGQKYLQQRTLSELITVIFQGDPSWVHIPHHIWKCVTRQWRRNMCESRVNERIFNLNKIILRVVLKKPRFIEINTEPIMVI